MPVIGESNVPGAPGNLAAFQRALNTGYPQMQGAPQSGFPGAPMGMQIPPQLMQQQTPYGPKPFNLDIEGEEDKLKKIGASATIDLDANQRLQFGGGYTPASVDPMGIPTSAGYNLNARYETPGMGINVNWRGGNRQMGGGFPGSFNAGLQGRW
jgi:hypothetical protein